MRIVIIRITSNSRHPNSLAMMIAIRISVEKNGDENRNFGAENQNLGDEMGNLRFWVMKIGILVMRLRISVMKIGKWVMRIGISVTRIGMKKIQVPGVLQSWNLARRWRNHRPTRWDGSGGPGSTVANPVDAPVHPPGRPLGRVNELIDVCKNVQQRYNSSQEYFYTYTKHYIGVSRWCKG